MQIKKLQEIHRQKKEKQLKHNSKDGHQTTREQKKRGREEIRPTKTNPKQ